MLLRREEKKGIFVRFAAVGFEKNIIALLRGANGFTRVTVPSAFNRDYQSWRRK